LSVQDEKELEYMCQFLSAADKQVIAMMIMMVVVVVVEVGISYV
jgi:hypothetical protein